MVNTEPIVSPEWLRENLNNPQVKIVDCRFALADPAWGQQQYQESHILGAFHLDLNRDLSSPVTKHGGRHPLPNIDELGDKLGKMGIEFGETHVVAYDDARFAFAGRLWWLLRYMGHDRISLLDGGFKSWQAAGYPVSEELPGSPPAKFTPKLRSDWVVSYEQVKVRKDQPGVVLVDSRDHDRYLGKHEPIDPIAGHIPGAVNLPWQQVTDDQGFVKSTQQQRWTEYQEAEEIIVYCGSGVTACANLLSLELAGLSQGKLYAGSWSDWCSYQLDPEG